MILKNLLTLFVIISIGIASILSGLSVSSAISVETQNLEQKKWTYMYYEIFDEGNETDLYLFLQDLFLNLSIISNKKINVVALIDYKRAFTGYFAPRNSFMYNFTIIEEFSEINGGNYTVLRDFILKCKTDFPAERYFLHCCGHGHAWHGVLADYKSNESVNGYDDLTMEELHKALDESGGVDILKFGTCYTGCIESAYEVRNCTEIYIGSEAPMYVEGPWIGFIQDLKILRKNSHLSTVQIAKKSLAGYKKYRPYFLMSHYIQCINFAIKNKKMEVLSIPPFFTMSVIRTDKLDELCSAIDNFSKVLIDNMDSIKTIINKSRLRSDDFPITIGTTIKMGFQIDIGHFSKLMSKPLYKILKPELYTAANDVLTCVDEAVVAKWHQVGYRHSYGLSIFFPENRRINYPQYPFMNRYTMENYTSHKLEFTDDTLWDEFLRIYLSDVLDKTTCTADHKIGD